MRDTTRSIVSIIAAKPCRVITCAALAVALTAAPVVSPLAAYAVSAETQAEIDEAQSQVDQYASAYNSAVEKLDELQKTIDDNTARIAEIEEKLPAQQEEAQRAMRDMYKFQATANPLVSFVLNSTSLSDFITTCAYMDEIQSANVSVIEELSAMQTELEEKQTELDQAKAQIEQEKQTAADALAKAQSARTAAQKKAEAEAAAELAALKKEPEKEQTAPASGTGVSGENTHSNTTSGEKVETTVSSGGVNWNMSYDAFISEWTGRIDAYLAGSPMAGCGRIFAEAAWNAGVDPRWSPAIACIESTKGKFVPYGNSYNAWGWTASGGGFRRFGSWEEGIRAHVSYLANVYGSTITISAAKKYCPPKWQSWYNNVSAQMNSI